MQDAADILGPRDGRIFQLPSLRASAPLHSGKGYVLIFDCSVLSGRVLPLLAHRVCKLQNCQKITHAKSKTHDAVIDNNKSSKRDSSVLAVMFKKKRREKFEAGVSADACGAAKHSFRLDVFLVGQSRSRGKGASSTKAISETRLR